MTDPARRIATFFESFSPADVGRLAQWYTEDASFKDPFNEVKGLDAIARVYGHMFEQVEDPRFAVLRTLSGDGECWLTWDFSFGPASRRTRVHGASHLLLDARGRIRVHRDYWDPAAEIYEKVPVLGALMRAIRRRLSAPAGR